MRKSCAKLFAVAILLILGLVPAGMIPARAQSTLPYENKVAVEDLRRDVEYLAHEMTNGRASGTPGKELAEHYLVSQFRNLGLKPWNWNYTQSFRYRDSIIVRNVVGYLPASIPSDEYIVIGAHYDHAFDGKELDMFGSRRFVRNLDIPHSKITAMVNMDMLGTDLVPPRRNREYLFAIGENSLPESYRGYLSYICTRARYKMDLDLTFYGSRNFWKMMYETSDQHPFARAGIPAVLFTSAFHQHTLKKTDTPAIIDYQLLRKRTLVIYNFILRLCAEN